MTKANSLKRYPRMLLRWSATSVAVVLILTLTIAPESVRASQGDGEIPARPVAADNSGALPDSSQTGEEAAQGDVLTAEQLEIIEQQAEIEQAVFQLRDIQQSLSGKRAQLKSTERQINSAASDELPTLESERDKLRSEIQLLEKTFEQIAIGDVDLSTFGIEDKPFNWRDELVEIVKPLIENVKALTEKPRKIETLRRLIEEKSASRETAEQALAAIAALQVEAQAKAVVVKLDDIKADWQGRLEDIDRKMQLAEYQLDSLQGNNTPWYTIVREGLLDFVSGRGLTLVLIVIVATGVWAVMRGLLWLIRKRSTSSKDRSTKTYYRLAAYAYRFLTLILIGIAVMMVLYFRQDLLLLAFVLILFFGAALALKNLLPKYITESRLLLNIGSVREKERIIFNGIPWRVSSINVQSRLLNPEIRGAIRLPISHMHEMISRPTRNEPWFPSSEGDWVLDAENDPVLVKRQTPDVVELEDLDSLTRNMPTADYFQAGYPNLSRAEAFRVTVLFGIDYATQQEDMAVIEEAFAAGIKQAFAGSEIESSLTSVNVDFHSAGDSSLNYLMLTRFKPEAAGHYNRIKRRIQRACVAVCNENNWGIPFPQMSVELSAEGSAEVVETDESRG